VQGFWALPLKTYGLRISPARHPLEGDGPSINLGPVFAIFDHELVVTGRGGHSTFGLLTLEALIEGLVELAPLAATKVHGLTAALFGASLFAIFLAIEIFLRKASALRHGLSNSDTWEAERSTDDRRCDDLSHVFSPGALAQLK
jgi:hypothetical protein